MSASRRERSSTLQALSDDLATAVEHAAASVVAVNARPRIASSGVHWRPGVVVTPSHTVRRDDDVTVTLPDRRTRPAPLAGRGARCAAGPAAVGGNRRGGCLSCKGRVRGGLLGRRPPTSPPPGRARRKARPAPIDRLDRALGRRERPGRARRASTRRRDRGRGSKTRDRRPRRAPRAGAGACRLHGRRQPAAGRRTTDRQPIHPGTPGAISFAAELPTLAERLRRATVQVRGRSPGTGSGIVWRPRLIVTNAHVATGRSVVIESADGAVLKARLAASDRQRDLAALEADTDRKSVV